MPDDDVYPSLSVPTPPRDPDEQRWNVESVIGSRVLLGAGLVSLLAGTVFFVKLSNDNQWIPPQVRILCGLDRRARTACSAARGASPKSARSSPKA